MSATSANIAGLIAGSGLGWTLVGNLFIGGLVDGDDLPDLQLSVTNYSGDPLETFGSSTQRPQVQVLLRGDKDSFAEAEVKANSLWSFLANVRNVSVPTTVSGVTVGPVVIQALTPSGTVNPMGKDDQQRSLMSMNFTVMV